MIEDIDPAKHLDHLKNVLGQIKIHDTNYGIRETLIYLALINAKRAGMEVGFRIDPEEPNWPVAYIELPLVDQDGKPAGQVSWHMPQHKHEYDGHTTEEKYQRIDAYVSQGS